MPLWEMMASQEKFHGSIISSHKTGFSLLEKMFKEEMANQSGVDIHSIQSKVKIALKVGAEIGIDDDMKNIEEDLNGKYFVNNQLYSVADIKEVIDKQKTRTDVPRNQRNRIKKDMEVLENTIKENNHQQSPLTELNPNLYLKLSYMTWKLNQSRKEHDVLVILPKYKTVIQIEIKAVEQLTDKLLKLNGQFIN